MAGEEIKEGETGLVNVIEVLHQSFASTVAPSDNGHHVLATSPMSNSAVNWYLPDGQTLIDYARSVVGTASAEEQQRYLLPP